MIITQFIYKYTVNCVLDRHLWHWNYGRDQFNQNSDRSDWEKRTTSKGRPVFSKLFRLDRTNTTSFGAKFLEILVEWIAPYVSV